MWDKPNTLRQLANVLFGISFVLALYGALHYVLHTPEFPLRAVQLSTAPNRVDVAQVEVVVRNELRGNFFTVDLESTRHAFEKLPWVRKVSVRRHFPWRLEVSLEEHVALAHWNGNELVNTHGEVFLAEADQTLPKFIGQPGTSSEVAQMYSAFGEQLVPLKQGIVQISLSPRHAWQLRLNNDMVLELGHEQAQQRLARFVAVQKTENRGQKTEDRGQKTEDRGQKTEVRNTVKYVDLRYRNGFAVRQTTENKRAEG